MYLMYPAQFVVESNSNNLEAIGARVPEKDPILASEERKVEHKPKKQLSLTIPVLMTSQSTDIRLPSPSTSSISSHHQAGLFSHHDVPPSPSLSTASTIGARMMPTLKLLRHKGFEETLQSHSRVAFKLIKNVADFTQQLSTIHEQHAEALQQLVETFRIRNAELRRERPSYQNSMFATWETLLQEIEADSQVHNDISRNMGRQVSTPLLEKTFHRKVQSRKVFLHRDSFETILQKAEEMLQKCYKEYEETYHKVLENRNHTQLGAYYDAHNRYVQQLHATNGMNEEYYNQTLPSLMEELEDIYVSLSESVSTAVCGAAEILKVKSEEQVARYEMIHNTGKNINSKTDMSNFIKTLSIDVKALATTSEFTKHVFVSAQVDSQAVSSVDTPDQPQVLKDEVVLDNLAEIQVPAKPDSLRQEVNSLENQIRQLTEALDSLTRLQQRSLESSLYNKANELEEDISLKKFDLRVAQIHLAAVSKQLELFVGKLNIKLEDLTSARDRKMSSISSPVTGSIKNKWMRAFRSLKAGHGSSNISNGSADSASDRKKQGLAVLPEYQHIFQEYTYKRITACDYCREVLRGHVRQGLKCKLCKMNVHAHCLSKVPKCQPKPKLLRRQKSASEIETKIVTETGDESKQSAMLMVSSSAGPSTATAGVSMNPLETELTGPLSTATSAVGSSQIERRTSSPTSSSTVPTINLAPQSPVHNRRLLTTGTAKAPVRMSSVDLPDEAEKSLSSASTSPCPSPKPHRLLPTNLYVVLYNFRGRHQDELDLRAGYKVTVVDTTDPDWWKGKCLGKAGFFPSKYVTKLHPGERPLQVTHNIQVSEGANNHKPTNSTGTKLLRDQIVIQTGEESDGMVRVRTGDKQVSCPLSYLTEV